MTRNSSIILALFVRLWQKMRLIGAGGEGREQEVTVFAGWTPAAKQRHLSITLHSALVCHQFRTYLIWQIHNGRIIGFCWCIFDWHALSACHDQHPWHVKVFAFLWGIQQKQNCPQQISGRKHCTGVKWSFESERTKWHCMTSHWRDALNSLAICGNLVRLWRTYNWLLSKPVIKSTLLIFNSITRCV